MEDAAGKGANNQEECLIFGEVCFGILHSSFRRKTKQSGQQLLSD